MSDADVSTSISQCLSRWYLVQRQSERVEHGRDPLDILWQASPVGIIGESESFHRAEETGMFGFLDLYPSKLLQNTLHALTQFAQAHTVLIMKANITSHTTHPHMVHTAPPNPL